MKTIIALIALTFLNCTFAAYKLVYMTSSGLSPTVINYSRASNVGQWRYYKAISETGLTAILTTFTPTISAITANERLASGRLTLCQLPDTVISTEEF